MVHRIEEIDKEIAKMGIIIARIWFYDHLKAITSKLGCRWFELQFKTVTRRFSKSSHAWYLGPKKNMDGMILHGWLKQNLVNQ
jgi:hypothetical protein